MSAGSEGAADTKIADNLAIAVVLFPGFLTLSVSEYLAYSPKLEGVQLVAAALTATLIDLGIALAVTLPFRKADTLTTVVLRPWFIVTIAGISILTGIAWAMADSSQWIYHLRFTDRVSRADVWNVAFAQNNRLGPPQYVRVITAAGEVYHGVPTYFSEGTEERALLISNARREIRVRAGKRGAADSIECVPVGVNPADGKVLILKDQIRVVEFRSVDRTKQPFPYLCDTRAPLPSNLVKAERHSQ